MTTNPIPARRCVISSAAYIAAEAPWLLLVAVWPWAQRASSFALGTPSPTPRGVYVKCGNSWLLPDGEGAVVSTGKTFLSPKGAAVKTGDTYLSSEGNAVSTGHTVLRNFDDDPD